MSVPPFATRVARRALGLGLELFSTCALPAPMAPAMAPDTAFRVTIGLDVGLDVDGDGGTAPRPGLSEGGRSRMTAAAKWAREEGGCSCPRSLEITDARSGCGARTARSAPRPPRPLPRG